MNINLDKMASVKEWVSLTQVTRENIISRLDLDVLALISRDSEEGREMINNYFKRKFEWYSIEDQIECYVNQRWNGILSDGRASEEKKQLISETCNKIKSTFSRPSIASSEIKQALNEAEESFLVKFRVLEFSVNFTLKKIFDGFISSILNGQPFDNSSVVSPSNDRSYLFQTIFTLENPRLMKLNIPEGMMLDENLEGTYQHLIPDSAQRARLGSVQDQITTRGGRFAFACDMGFELDLACLSPNTLVQIHRMMLNEARNNGYQIQEGDSGLDFAFPYRGKVQDHSMLITVLKKLYEEQYANPAIANWKAEKSQ